MDLISLISITRLLKFSISQIQLGTKEWIYQGNEKTNKLFIRVNLCHEY